VTSERAEVGYYCTDYYAPQYERSLIWNDASLNIAWPLPKDVQPLLNDKDSTAQTLKQSEYFP
jgi:dTDP-4-dehydrorhamnose 3,5-epimerase